MKRPELHKVLRQVQPITHTTLACACAISIGSDIPYLKSHYFPLLCFYRDTWKLMLYTDDTMLLLGDTYESLQEAMSVISNFGIYSGLVINWTKLSIMLLDAVSDNQESTCKIFFLL